jgi:RND family efflux transporter MFP subunit
MRKNYYKLMTISLLLLAMQACKKDSDTATMDEVMAVDVSEVITDSITLHRNYPGILKSAATVNVVGRVNGIILRQLYTAGEYVTKGTPLFEIEKTIYVNAVNEATAQLATAESEYTYNSKEYNAMTKAYAKDAVAEMDVIQAKSNMQQSEAAIKSAQAALSDAQTKLSYCTVVAPVSGFISDSPYNPGGYINGADSPVILATIYDNSSLQVNFNIEEDSFVEVFDEAKARNVSMKDIPLIFNDNLLHSYTAAISYMAPNVDTSTGTILLKGRIQNPYNELKSGMYATVRLPYKRLPHALLVRDAAISTDQRGKYLYTVNDSNRVVYTPIEVGELYQDSLRVVLNGIKPSDRYVTKALLKVRPGMQVKPLNK